jgi:hypothetical protein
MKRAVGYVSFGNDTQKVAVETFCALNDLSLSDLFTDSDFNVKFSERPAGKALIDLVNRRKDIDTIVIANVEYLSDDILDFFDLTRPWEKRKIALRFLDFPADWLTAVGRFALETVVATFELRREDRARIDHLERSLRYISQYCTQEPDLAEFALRAAENPPTAFPPKDDE